MAALTGTVKRRTTVGDDLDDSAAVGSAATQTAVGKGRTAVAYGDGTVGGDSIRKFR